MKATPASENPGKDHIGKLPGDDGWFNLATKRSILAWTIVFGVLLLLLIPVALVLIGSDVPTRVLLGIGLLYVVGLFGAAAACDRAVQLERIRRR